MDKTFNFDLDKVNKMEEVANCLGAITVATIKLKDMGVKNDDIIPILRSLLGIDIEPSNEHAKIIPNILDMVRSYATIKQTDMNTAINELLSSGKSK